MPMVKFKNSLKLPLAQLMKHILVAFSTKAANKFGIENNDFRYHPKISIDTRMFFRTKPVTETDTKIFY